MSSPPVREITFVAPYALPAIDPAVPGFFGGLETQSWTLARLLARRGGWKVHFAVSGAPLRRQYDGVNLVRLSQPLAEIRDHVARHLDLYHHPPYVRLKTWSWHLLWELPFLALTRPFRSTRDLEWQALPAYCRLAGQVLVTFGVSEHAARVMVAGEATRRPTVLFLAADSDLDARFATDPNYVGPYGNKASICLKVLQHATVIVSQTELQAKLLKERFGRESVIIRNPIDEVSWDQGFKQTLPAEMADLDSAGYVLWIGRADAFHKRAMKCVELARALPAIPFLMIMNRLDPQVESEVRAAQPANLRIVTQVPFHQMPAVFDRARLFVNTSAASMEGFPNVFLQAALSRTPACSLDFGRDFLERYGCGVHCRNEMQELIRSVDRLWHNPPTPQQTDAARRRVLQDYGATPVIDALCQILEPLLTADKAKSAE